MLTWCAGIHCRRCWKLVSHRVCVYLTIFTAHIWEKYISEEAKTESNLWFVMVDGLFLASSVARACLNNIEAIYVPKVVYIYMLYACMYMCVVYLCGRKNRPHCWHGVAHKLKKINFKKCNNKNCVEIRHSRCLCTQLSIENA